jgi:hypothetical protein
MQSRSAGAVAWLERERRARPKLPQLARMASWVVVVLRVRRHKLKVSHTFRLTPSQRYLDARRAARALGRRLRRPECVHHFTETQLVICQDPAYHALLHRLAYARRIERDPAFVESEAEAYIQKQERSTARSLAQQRLLIAICSRAWFGSHLCELPSGDKAVCVHSPIGPLVCLLDSDDDLVPFRHLPQMACHADYDPEKLKADLFNLAIKRLDLICGGCLETMKGKPRRLYGSGRRNIRDRFSRRSWLENYYAPCPMCSSRGRKPGIALLSDAGDSTLSDGRSKAATTGWCGGLREAKNHAHRTVDL